MSDSDPFRKSMLSKPAGQTAAVGGGIGAVIITVVGLFSQSMMKSDEQTMERMIRMQTQLERLSNDVSVINTKMEGSDRRQDDYRKAFSQALQEIKEDLKEITAARRRR